MTPAEVQTAMETLGWGPVKTARALGLPYRTFVDAQNGTRQGGLHPSAALLLHLATRFPAVRAELERMAGE